MVPDIKKEEFEYWNQADLEKQHILIAGPVKWEDSEAFAKTHWSMLTEGVTPLHKGSSILEIGCGVGRMLKMLSETTDYKLAGVDISPNMIERAREYVGNEAVTLKTVVEEMLPFPGNSFDFVYSIFVFQHIPTKARIKKYLSEIERVLRPGGRVRIQTCKGPAHPETSYGFTHGSYYPTVDAFADDFTAAGLSVIRRDDGIGFSGTPQIEWIWVTAKEES